MKKVSASLPFNKPIQQKIEVLMQQLRQTETFLPAITIVHNIQATSVLYMSERGLKTLDVTLEELQAMGPSYHDRFFNPQFAKLYVPKILGLLERNNNDEIISYYQQVRKDDSQEWSWYLSCTKIFVRDDAGSPLLIITNAIPLDADHFVEAAKARRLLEETVFSDEKNHLFNHLSKREKEILKRMALGQSAVIIAKDLFISEMTVNTHRRNIKRKLNIESNYDITRFAHAFDLL